tara:strand:- start:3744 stop:4001 length:258 start_codon:yes stop_codon:yes gene_type:complete
MEELKTLNEFNFTKYLEINEGEIVSVASGMIREDLKAEAIKRAKVYKGNRDDFPKDSIDRAYWNGKFQAELFAHNLTMDDLKNGE